MKRVFSIILAAVLFITCVGGTAMAAHEVEPYASLTLSYYDVDLVAGDSKGVLSVGFTVRSGKLADEIGVEKIKIYKSDGSFVTTITGTTSNGLVWEDGSGHKGTYKYKGTSGTSYYAEVTVFATVGSDSDSRTITTSTVEAP